VPIESALKSRHEPNKPQIFPEKPGIRGNSTFYVLRDLIDLLMIPRKIGGWPDQRGFNTVRGYSNMALKKTTTGASTATAKKTAAKGSTAKKAAPKKAAGTAKKAAPKKAAGPKLSPAQGELLKKVAGAGETGYHADKKPENKSLESLVKHKLVKRGKKHPTTKNFHYAITKAGQKHLESGAALSPSSPSAPKMG
jgi:hypothetical protein